MAKKGTKRSLEEASAPRSPLEVRRADVPEYLRKGEFFRSLGEEEGDDEFFVVPGDAMKNDDTIANAEDLVHILKSLRFWGVDGVVAAVVGFIIANPNAPRLKSSLALFEPDYPYLFTLRKLLRNKFCDKLRLVLELGDLDLVKHFLTEEAIVKGGTDLALIAARLGHLDCLTYLHEKKCSWDGKALVGETVQGGSLECLKYVHAQDPNFPDHVTTTDYPEFISAERLDCFIYCYRHGGLFKEKTFATAFLSEGIKTIKYCVEEGVALNAAVIAGAARSGLIGCVKYLHELNCPMDATVCANATIRGDLAMLKFLHEAGCPWNANTTYYAAQCGWLPCLRYAHEHGCAWEWQSYNALRSDSVIYQYLEQHGCPKQAWW